MQQQDRTPAFVAVHFDLSPAHVTDARTKRFRRGFFGRDARCQPVRLVSALAAFLRGKKARVEPFAVPFSTARDTRHIHQVHADAQHQPRYSISGPATANA